MHGDGVEPSNPKERIYSPPRLATSLSMRIDAPHYPVNSGQGSGCTHLQVFPWNAQTDIVVKGKDRAGFEPADDFRRLRFSRPVFSATQPSIHISNRGDGTTPCRKVVRYFLTVPLERLCCAVIARVGLEPTTFGL